MPLSSETLDTQVLNDYVNLLDHVKTTLNATDCPAIAFGGERRGSFRLTSEVLVACVACTGVARRSTELSESDAYANSNEI